MMGQLAAALAHELNQPLHAILRNAEAAEIFLESDQPDLEELRAIVSDIRKDDERAGNVIDRLRSLLKRRNIESVPAEVDALLNDVVALTRSDAAARQVALEVEVAPGLPMVKVDRVHVQQVLLNLMLNAMDAMNGISAGPKRVSLRAAENGKGLVEIAVKDTGHGIEKEKLAHLFEPFFTTKTHGMGVGLAISRTIVEAHGGTIWAENNPDGGATFRFTLATARDGAAR
jgi:signal transduction histidine kinase